MSEYALILLLVSLFAVTALGSLAMGVSGFYESSTSRVLAIVHHQTVTTGLSSSSPIIHTTNFATNGIATKTDLLQATPQ